MKAESAKFWEKFPEKEDLNQYWYSVETIDMLATEISENISKGGRCAFLSTPSVYFAVRQRQENNFESILFDFDEKFTTEGSNFVHYDFNKPEAIPPNLHKSFDFVVIDPPFITREVWEKYTSATKLLLRSNESKILLSTIQENAEMLKELLDCNMQIFKPSIPHLVYQYALYTNYDSSNLSKPNPLID